jgi:hypothetical protein
VETEFARARQVLGRAVRRGSSCSSGSEDFDLIRSLNCNPKHCPGQLETFVVSVFRNQEACDVSEESGDWCAVCKTRQENAEVYRHFAEELYSVGPRPDALSFCQCLSACCSLFVWSYSPSTPLGTLLNITWASPPAGRCELTILGHMQLRSCVIVSMCV